MTQTSFDAEIAGPGRASANLEPAATIADRALWERASVALSERSYRTDAGEVRIDAEWHRGRLALRVIDERKATTDVTPFAELFCHEAFLLLNLAVPGSCGGIVLSDAVLDAKIFEFAWTAAKRDGWPRIDPLPLADVMRWYDALQLGTAQVATSAATKALFTLLHLAQTDDERTSVLWLAEAVSALAPELESLLGRKPQAIDVTSAPLIHPLHDEELDARVDDAALQLADTADQAAAIVIAALQAMVRKHAR
jgi:hypothetical protein